MDLKVDNIASGIVDYQALSIPCYYEDKLHIAIRSYSHNAIGYFLLVEPNTLRTICVRKGDIRHRKPVLGQNENGYYTKEAIATTPYGFMLERLKNTTHPITNDGITHSMRQHEPNQIFLTIDLCPSNKPFEKAFFERLAALTKLVPIVIFITEFWRTLHAEEFQWLIEQQRQGTLQITWGNHSATHLYYHDLHDAAGLERNFLLDSGTNLDFELFEIEKSLIAHGQTPSVFFRAPGLVTDEKLMHQLNRVGLITIGADAWLAKGELPCSGSIVLVHGNSNEPAGIALAMSLLDKEEWEFLALYEACIKPGDILDYMQKSNKVSAGSSASASILCVDCCAPSRKELPLKRASLKQEEMADEATDDEAEKELGVITTKLIGASLWEKPLHAPSGTRICRGVNFATAGQRLTLFRHLKTEKHEIKQYSDVSDNVDLVVALPTIFILRS